jgi:hypothetical protein
MDFAVLLFVVTGGLATAEDAVQTPLAKVGFHEAVYDPQGRLLPWTPWTDAIQREMNFYAKCPVNTKGYPAFVCATFLGGDYNIIRMDSIPATQNGLAILGYLKYWEHGGRQDARELDTAKIMGDYLVKETLTPNEGVYPRFTRSTGFHMDFPLFRSSQGDARYGQDVIEPDKGGIAGYALVKLYEATHTRRYLKQAIRNADALARTMRPGSAFEAPWPFRVDAITGKGYGERNGNMAYILRLFDALIDNGYKRYQAPRDALWEWIKTYEIASPEAPEQCLWVSFFEDYDLPNNRNSWAPLEMARYLIERKEKLDPDWKTDAERLIQFALKYFSSTRPGGVTVMGEQDDDKDPWGGACAKLGGVAALFYAAGGGEQYKEIAYRNLTWMTYFIDNDGCPAQKADTSQLRRGGWLEDCHADVIHNFMDALAAMPEWGSKTTGP